MDKFQIKIQQETFNTERATEHSTAKFQNARCPGNLSLIIQRSLENAVLNVPC